METGEEPPELLSPTFTETHLGAKLMLTFDQNRIPATSKKFSNVLNACKTLQNRVAQKECTRLGGLHVDQPERTGEFE